jgi:hypothetical protein
LGNSVLNQYGEKQPLTVHRFAAGTRVNGKWVRGNETLLQVPAVVVPYQPQIAQGGGAGATTQVEGQESRGGIVIYTAIDQPLRAASQGGQTDADVVEYDGRRFQVQTSDKRWQIAALAHCRAVAFEEDPA